MKKLEMKKIVGLLLMALLAICALTGCGKAKDSTDTQSGKEAPRVSSQEASDGSGEGTQKAEENFKPVNLRVAYMPNMGSASLAVTAKDEGFFKAMGLNVELVEFQGGPAEIAAMSSGDIAIAQIGHGAHALCIEGEGIIFQIDCTSLADAVIGNKSKGINTIADLKGKKVATTSGTSAEIILELALKSAGLTQKDLEIVEMDANGIVSAMVSGNIDACATWSPGTMTIKDALGEKAVTLANNNDYVDQATFPSSFITTNKYATANRDILVRFSRALQNASDYRKANIDQVAKLVAKQCEVDESTMVQCVGEGQWLDSEFLGKALKDGTLRKYYENQQQIFIDSGRIKEKVDVDKYVLFDVMQEAYDENHK